MFRFLFSSSAPPCQRCEVASHQNHALEAEAELLRVQRDQERERLAELKHAMGKAEFEIRRVRLQIRKANEEVARASAAANALEELNRQLSTDRELLLEVAKTARQLEILVDAEDVGGVTLAVEFLRAQLAVVAPMLREVKP